MACARGEEAWDGALVDKDGQYGRARVGEDGVVLAFPGAGRWLVAGGGQRGGGEGVLEAWAEHVRMFQR